MPEVPSFFVPAASSTEESESVYKSLAEWCSAPVPPIGSRIYSITFTHNGESWTATVGEQLTGTTLENPRSRSRRPFVPQTLGDRATVLAIFPGYPYKVVTNSRFGGIASAWENPFFVGTPTRETLFTFHRG